ncbi:hypothetical protein CLPU_58c00020 [Gottschalkia purinilytica]|uniref:Uncharacterized protein n=1 Tax=Gottschalkia purinilytica TaxID=1503 RepID=A0A0L0W600_GOTPU|nr:hypothetical protein [Gottschalkia purinilytica]KNF06939.1 hypothetical protein CLPU_58c00020 [Gottschalkia purinilytica]
MRFIFKEAHRLTKEIVEKFKDVDYKTQFKLCLTYLLEERKVQNLVYEVEDIEISTGNLRAKVWEKHGKKRIYINQVWYVRGGKDYRSCTLGYYDLNRQGKYIEDMKGIASTASMGRYLQERLNEINF